MLKLWTIEEFIASDRCPKRIKEAKNPIERTKYYAKTVGIEPSPNSNNRHKFLFSEYQIQRIIKYIQSVENRKNPKGHQKSYPFPRQSPHVYKGNNLYRLYGAQ